jgi:hypothetical protein
MTGDQRPLVSDLFPEFTAEMVAALTLDAEGDLVAQIPGLAFWGRCSCADDFCASFYTGPRPSGRWSDDGDHDNVVLAVDMGMVVFDLVDRAIRYVEVLDRPDVKRLVAPLAPLERGRP